MCFKSLTLFNRNLSFWMIFEKFNVLELTVFNCFHLSETAPHPEIYKNGVHFEHWTMKRTDKNVSEMIMLDLLAYIFQKVEIGSWKRRH